MQQPTDERVRSCYEASAGTTPGHAAVVADGDARTIVVGGGYAGLATACGLIDRGDRDVLVIEGEHVGFGASGRNGGFVFGGYSLGESSLLRQLGPAVAKRVYARSTAAVDLIRRRLHEYAIDCDLVDEGVLWTNWFRDERVLRDRAALLKRHFDTEWEWIDGPGLRRLLDSPRYSAALFERNALHLHPLKYARGLARAVVAGGGRVAERTRIVALARTANGWQLRTTGGHILRCERVVLSCGGYLAGLSPTIDRSILPIATYVVATAPLGERLAQLFPGTRAAVYDSRFAFDYYRPLADTRLLWGGRISIRDRSPEQVAALLQRDIARVFPQLGKAPIDYAWSGLMSYARHEMPQIGELEPGLWYAQAFGGHGLATTTAAGELLADSLCGDRDGLADYRSYGLSWAGKPFGFLAAQATYWWFQGRDAFKDWRESAQ
jgi:gamma-glutamylputrescine oxidase